MAAKKKRGKGNWKHGWIPLTASARASKAGKGRAGSGKASSTNRTAAPVRSASPARKSAGVSLARAKKGSVPAKPTIQHYSTMTNADKIAAAATMYGTGSRQHLAAKKKFSGKR